jgi:hypothetical protein
MIAAIRAFHDVAFGPAAPELPALVRALDALAMAYHVTPKGVMSEKDLDPPERDYKQAYARIGERFPMLGYYGVADPLETDGNVMIGDAIDDLADIANDLSETLWRCEHLGLGDASWHFHRMFFHWGWHMRELQSFLNAYLFRR